MKRRPILRNLALGLIGFSAVAGLSLFFGAGNHGAAEFSLPFVRYVLILPLLAAFFLILSYWK
jgi:hypothetical protein